MVFQLGICELFAPPIHGLTNNSSKNIVDHFMVTELLYLSEFYDGSFLSILNMAQRKWQYAMEVGLINNTYKHPIVENFESIVEKKLFISLDIVDSKYLECGELVGIKKTFWIKIIQRLYKRVFKERKKIIELRKSPRTLHYKKTNGIWPKYCIRLPEYRFFNVS